MSWASAASKLTTIVRERIDAWADGEMPDAAGVLAEHPELVDAKSLVLELALTEYALRMEAGEAVEYNAFCDQFPEHRVAIEKLLEVQQWMDRRPPEDEGKRVARWPTVGDEFLGYKIEEPLGRGGLARVFLARERAVGDRLVVIKVSPLGGHEAQTLGKLSHPSIVPIFSAPRDEVGGWTVICMPLVGVATGVDLLDAAFSVRGQERAGGLPRQGGQARDGAIVQRVARQTRPLTAMQQPEATRSRGIGAPVGFSSYGDAIGRLGLEVAEGLAAAHAVGILHRDIKPSNILLAWTGRAMLLDFNLATGGGAKMQPIGGTLAYMAPEVIASLAEGRGKAAGQFDPRCDVYSLGVVLYELLAGRLPHKPAEQIHGSNPAGPAGRTGVGPGGACETWLECKRQGAASLVVAGGDVDPRLAAIVERCVSFDPAARPATAAALAEELRAYLGIAASVRRFAMRRRREVLIGAAVAVIGIGTAAAYVGTRPTRLESLYQDGLAQYDEGKFAEAAEAFTRCLELRSGWPQALFGRAQALRRMEKWKEARVDYMGLREQEPAWAYALAGYCNMRQRDHASAMADFMNAHERGLRNIGFLLNHANTQRKRGRYAEAMALYSEILEIDPQHKLAVRERALMSLSTTMNQRSTIPRQQAIDDVHRYIALEASYDGPYVAALVYADAARKDPGFEKEAIRYLTSAIDRGLPRERVVQLPMNLKRLLPNIDAKLVFRAIERDTTSNEVRSLIVDPPEVADWSAFRRTHCHRAQLAAWVK